MRADLIKWVSKAAEFTEQKDEKASGPGFSFSIQLVGDQSRQPITIEASPVAALPANT